jgi:transcriptional regulator GlxA family with amidase domain
VADLFLRMKTQEAEIAAAVHFTAQSLAHQTKGEVSEIAIFEAVKQWKQNRRPPLQDEEIAQAIRDLNVLGWIRAQVSEDLLLPRAALLDL